MSTRLTVVSSVLALIRAACPGPEIKGLDKDAALPEQIPAEGLIIVRNSNPGDPEVELSPLTYHYEHPIKVELAAPGSATETTHQMLDRMLGQIGAAVEADRYLGDLCHWLDVSAPDVNDIKLGSVLIAGAWLEITASYATANPLT